jgi:hypothetical protein
MKYYKEGRFYPEEGCAYVLSRSIGFGFEDNRLGASYDNDRSLGIPPLLHSKQMKAVIRRMWKISLRHESNYNDFE